MTNNGPDLVPICPDCGSEVRVVAEGELAFSLFDADAEIDPESVWVKYVCDRCEKEWAEVPAAPRRLTTQVVMEREEAVGKTRTEGTGGTGGTGGSGGGVEPTPSPSPSSAESKPLPERGYRPGRR